MRPAPRLRRALLAIACLSLLWAVWLVVSGGVNVRLFGVRFRSRDPSRVALVGFSALAGYLVAGGTAGLRAAVQRSRRFADQVSGRPGCAAFLIAASVVFVGLQCSTRVAGGSDAYGYVSQANLWLSGDLHVEQPWVADVPWPDREWTFTPGGYRPAEARATPSIVPTYSPGLPLIFSLATIAAGPCAMFAVVPLLGGLAVLLTYGMGRRAGSAWTGVAAGWLVATSPAMLSILMEPLTDVPVMAAWAGALYFLQAGTIASVLCSGAAAAMAVLIRPNLVPLACPLFLWLVFRGAGSTGSFRRGLIHGSVFGSAVLLGIVAVALINRALFGSPFTSGYGRFQDQFAWIHVVPNLRHYFTWLLETQTPAALLGFAALAAPSRRLWPGLSDKSLLAMFLAFVLVLWGEYSAYLEFESWGYLRFLLPSWPVLMLGLAAALLAIARIHERAGPPLAFVTVLVLGLWNLHEAQSRGVFAQRQAARHEAAIGQIVGEHTGPQSVVFASGRSGSVRYYGGRVTARYDFLPPDWLDRSVGWLTERGVQVYVLLDEGELPQFSDRFAGQRTLVALTTPVLVYEPAGIRLFDLSSPPDLHTVPSIVSKVPPARDECGPRAIPSLVFRGSPAAR